MNSNSDEINIYVSSWTELVQIPALLNTSIHSIDESGNVEAVKTDISVMSIRDLYFELLRLRDLCNSGVQIWCQIVTRRGCTPFCIDHSGNIWEPYGSRCVLSFRLLLSRMGWSFRKGPSLYRTICKITGCKKSSILKDECEIFCVKCGANDLDYNQHNFFKALQLNMGHYIFYKLFPLKKK